MPTNKPNRMDFHKLSDVLAASSKEDAVVMRQLGEEIRTTRMTHGYSRDELVHRLDLSLEELVAFENGIGNLDKAQNILEQIRQLN